MSEHRVINLQIGQINMPDNQDLDTSKVAYYIYLNNYLQTIIRQPKSVQVSVDKFGP